MLFAVQRRRRRAAASRDRLRRAAPGLCAPAIVRAYSGFPVDARCGGMPGSGAGRWSTLELGSPPMVTDVVQYAVLGLISARTAGAHGYQLKTEFDALYGDFWSLNYGQLYRTLDRLERAGLVQCTEEVQSGRPSRNVFRITASGQQNLDDWLLLPPTDEPRPLRDDLSVKLLFLTESRREETLALVRSQRAIYLHHLARLTKRRTLLEESGQDMFVTRLLLLQADMRVRTDLAWLDLVEKELLQRIEGKKAPRSTPPKHR